MFVEKKDVGNVLAAHFVDGSKFYVKRVRDLWQSETTDVERHLDAIFAFSRHLQVLRVVELNEDSLLKELNQYARETHHGAMQPSMSQGNENFIKINRGVLNLLSSLRTFLDFSETYLKRKYGVTSTQFSDFEAARGKRFDGSFSYRFCYKLRNYAQHCGLPVGGFETQTAFLSETETLTNWTVFLYRDELLSSFSWGKHVQEELAELPERFDLAPHLLSFVVDVRDLCAELIRIDLPSVSRSIETVGSLAREVSERYEDGKPVLYNFSPGERVYGDTYWLPVDLIEEIRCMLESNKLL